MTPAGRRRAALPALVLLAACGDEAARDEEAGDAAPAAIVARRDDGARSGWLAPDDRTDPARWLAARAAGRPLPADDPAVTALRTLLVRAQPHFVEDPRMIANRTAQVAGMVPDAPAPEALIAGLMAVAAPTGRRQLYGGLCQHYVTLRAGGAGHAAALARLRDSYGAQGAPPPR